MAYLIGMFIFSIYALYSLEFVFQKDMLEIKVLGIKVKQIEYQNIKAVKKNFLGGLTVFLKKGFPDRVYLFTFQNKEIKEKLEKILSSLRKN